MATWTVTIKAGYTGVVLPDGSTYSAGANAALSDLNFGKLLLAGQWDLVTLTSYAGSSSSVSNLTDLGDINVTSPTDRNLLEYDNATSKWLNVNRGPRRRTVASANATIVLSDDVVLMTLGGSNRVATLPALASAPLRIIIKKGDASANTITITPTSGTIDGAATFVMKNPYEAITLFQDGTNWWVI